MTIYCPTCREKLANNFRFCSKCGNPVPPKPASRPSKFKKYLPVGGAVIVSLLLVFLLLLATVKARIPGTWQRETMYLSRYGCDTIMIVTFHEDCTATQILTNADTGAVLHAEEGYWRVKGFEVQYIERSESFSDGHTPYSFVSVKSASV